MIDLVKLKLLAGDGGDGRVSFLREKYRPKGGPDGGKGGDGGHVILRFTKRLNTLKHLSHIKELLAKTGEMGGKNKRFGAKGESLVVEVPVGTLVWLVGENGVSRLRRQKHGLTELLSKNEIKLETYQVLKDEKSKHWSLIYSPPDKKDFPQESELLSGKVKLYEGQTDGEEIVICQGGVGGRGNESFKRPDLTTPLIAERGSEGEKKLIELELKLLAQVGLVGLPNAGKSTLLSVLTSAKPKIADYPFTTLEPNLGVLSDEWSGEIEVLKNLVIADIPGIIKGASEGKGLGLDFLRHIENCRVLVWVLSLDESLIASDSLSDQEKAKQLWDQMQLIAAELKNYRSDLIDKPNSLILSKSDLYQKETIDVITKYFDKQGYKLWAVSGATQNGLKSWLTSLAPRLAQPLD